MEIEVIILLTNHILVFHSLHSKMAAEVEREATLSDKSKHRRFAEIFFYQKQNCTFCDVVLKVCSREIYAHSNILAAASPYFEHFLSQDLPRLFSQRSPQIIEIQIDGSEPNVFYEEAVEKVIDFIYTGTLVVKECNVAQIYEISKIMDMDNVISFCEDFIQGKVQHDTIYQASDEAQLRNVTSNTEITSVKYGSMLDFWSAISKSSRAEKDAALLSKIKSKKFASVAAQTVPILPVIHEDHRKDRSQDEAVFNPVEMLTYLPRKRGRSQKDKNEITEESADETSPKKKRCEERESTVEKTNNMSYSESSSDTRRTFTTRSGRKVIQKYVHGGIDTIVDSNNSGKTVKVQIIKPEKSVAVKNVEGEASIKQDEEASIKQDEERSASNSYDSLPTETSVIGNSAVQNANDETEEKNETDPSERFCEEPHTKETQDVDKDPEDCERENNTMHLVISSSAEEGQEHTVDSNTFFPLERIDQIDTVSVKKKHFSAAKKYSCPECEFETSSVRDMTTHSMEHKLDKNQCFYCDLVIENRDELTQHVQNHNGPTPFECRDCNSHFKTRTMLNLHLPKHSDEKPFICEVCSMGFKWKHALTTHMTTHSNKKEHLCDTCGYTTAWKAQLKAHKLIHQGKTFKCERPGCSFETTKKQNLKFHEITHTGERKNVCDICGQTFSLRRNMRRHMLLHFSAKQHRCTDCEFASTRFDKLKEHMFKQHGKGTAPERRLKISELNKSHNLTIQPTGQFISAPDQVEVWSTEENHDTRIVFTTDDVTGAGSAAVNQTGEVTEAGLATLTQSGDVITVIKDAEQDTYAILNNILNASSGKSVIIQSEDGERIEGLQEFTAQQVEGEDATVIQQLVSDHQLSDGSSDRQAYQIISEGADTIQLSDNGSLEEQTIQVIDGDNKVQLIKIQDLATRMNLPEGLSLAGQAFQVIREVPSATNKTATVTSQAEPLFADTETYERVIVEPYASKTVHSSADALVMSDSNTHTDQVVIQGPDGAQVPVQVVKTV